VYCQFDDANIHEPRRRPASRQSQCQCMASDLIGTLVLEADETMHGAGSGSFDKIRRCEDAKKNSCDLQTPCVEGDSHRWFGKQPDMFPTHKTALPDKCSQRE
jgi:hypothetical protein